MGVHAKLASVMEAAERIPKRGHNDFHHYDYVTAADVVDHCRKLFLQAGLLLVPSCTDHRITMDGDSHITTLDLRYTIVDVDSGESIECPWVGEGVDKGDKATYKAMTGGLKYFLMDLLLIPTGDDPEADAAVDHRKAQRSGGGKPRQRKSTGGSGPTCPSCGTSEVWDNRAKKAAGDFSEKSPDYACKDKEGCGWTLWLDGAVKKIEAALDHLLDEDVIDEAEREIASNKARTGELSKVREVNDWIREKRVALDVPAGNAG